MQYAHLDASESVFFNTELEKIKARTYDIKYPALKAKMFIPVSNEAQSGVTQVTYEQWDQVGAAKIYAPGATDSPRVDVKAAQFTRPTRWGTASYGWSVIDIRQARIAGKPLDSKKAEACRRAQELLLDDVAALGAPDYGIAEGFLNNSALTIQPATGVWSTLTADQIIADIGNLWNNIRTDTKGIEAPDTLLLPDLQYGYIATTPRATVSDTTIMDFVLRTIPDLVNIEPWYRLAGAGAGSVDRGMAYRRDPSYVEQDIPTEFEILPVHQHGMNFEVMTLVQTAGTVFYYPKAARYIDGI